MTEVSTGHHHGPRRYEIRLEGHLDSRWATGHALVAIYDWALLLGPGVMPAFNALLLGYLLYRSGLVPRVIPLMGLIGAPLLLTSAITTMFGINEQVSVLSGIAVIPIFFWELSLGVYMVVKGFRPSAAHR